MPDIPVEFIKKTYIFPTDFRRKKNHPQISSFIKIRHVRAEFFHGGGRADGHDEANCRNFSKAPEHI
jgi:hypothetical protein